MKTDREILWEIEDAWEDIKDASDVMELSPKAIEWLIKKVRESL